MPILNFLWHQFYPESLIIEYFVVEPEDSTWLTEKAVGRDSRLRKSCVLTTCSMRTPFKVTFQSHRFSHWAFKNSSFPSTCVLLIFISSVRATCPANCNVLYFTTHTILGGGKSILVQAVRFPGVQSALISRRHVKVDMSALGTDRFYPQEVFMVLISVRGWVDSRTIVRPERLRQWTF